MGRQISVENAAIAYASLSMKSEVHPNDGCSISHGTKMRCYERSSAYPNMGPAVDWYARSPRNAGHLDRRAP